MKIKNIDDILKILPHRYPFLLVDKVISFTEKTIECQKNISINEPFFQGHFPDYPIMPGVLQIEGLAQSAGILLMKDINTKKIIPLFLGIDKARFKKEVRPGNIIKYKIEILQKKAGIYKCKGKIFNENNELVSKAELLLGLK